MTVKGSTELSIRLTLRSSADSNQYFFGI